MYHTISATYCMKIFITWMDMILNRNTSKWLCSQSVYLIFKLRESMYCSSYLNLHTCMLITWWLQNLEIICMCETATTDPVPQMHLPYHPTISNTVFFQGWRTKVSSYIHSNVVNQQVMRFEETRIHKKNQPTVWTDSDERLANQLPVSGHHEWE